jgi:hypothetical protein
MLAKLAEDDTGDGVVEVSEQYLGHVSPAIQRVYNVARERTYARMNRWLMALGQKLAEDGVI